MCARMKERAASRAFAVAVAASRNAAARRAFARRSASTVSRSLATSASRRRAAPWSDATRARAAVRSSADAARGAPSSPSPSSSSDAGRRRRRRRRRRRHSTRQLLAERRVSARERVRRLPPRRERGRHARRAHHGSVRKLRDTVDERRGGRTSGWSSKASVGVQRRRGRGSKARCGRRDAPGKVLKDRRSPRQRGRMGTSNRATGWMRRRRTSRKAFVRVSRQIRKTRRVVVLSSPRNTDTSRGPSWTRAGAACERRDARPLARAARRRGGQRSGVWDDAARSSRRSKETSSEKKAPFLSRRSSFPRVRAASSRKLTD